MREKKMKKKRLHPAVRIEPSLNVRIEPSLNGVHRKPFETSPTTWLGKYYFQCCFCLLMSVENGGTRAIISPFKPPISVRPCVTWKYEKTMHWVKGNAAANTFLFVLRLAHQRGMNGPAG